VEIVANDHRLVYQNVDDDADKILRVMGDVGLQAELHTHLDSRKQLFFHRTIFTSHPGDRPAF
jgi:hypothetical protein